MLEIIDHAKVAGQTKGDHAAGAKNFTMYVEFQMTTAEDHWDGPFIQVDVFDIYGAGVEKTVKLKSTLEKVLDVLSAIAKIIAEAASFLINWIWGMIQQGLEAVLAPVVSMVREFVGSLKSAFLEQAALILNGIEFSIRGITNALWGGFGDALSAVLLVVQVVLAVVAPFLVLFEWLLAKVMEIVIGTIVDLLIGTSVAGDEQALEASSPMNSLISALTGRTPIDPSAPRPQFFHDPQETEALLNSVELVLGVAGFILGTIVIIMAARGVAGTFGAFIAGNAEETAGFVLGVVGLLLNFFGDGLVVEGLALVISIFSAIATLLGYKDGFGKMDAVASVVAWPSLALSMIDIANRP